VPDTVDAFQLESVHLGNVTKYILHFNVNSLQYRIAHDNDTNTTSSEHATYSCDESFAIVEIRCCIIGPSSTAILPFFGMNLAKSLENGLKIVVGEIQ